MEVEPKLNILHWSLILLLIILLIISGKLLSGSTYYGSIALASIYQVSQNKQNRLFLQPTGLVVANQEIFSLALYLDLQDRAQGELKLQLLYLPKYQIFQQFNHNQVLPSPDLSFGNDTGMVNLSFFLPELSSGQHYLGDLVFKAVRSGYNGIIFNCTNSVDSKDGYKLQIPINCQLTNQEIVKVKIIKGSKESVSICSYNPPPPPANISAKSGVNKSEIELSWNSVSPVTYYIIYYGKQAGSYQYGIPRVERNDHFTITGLEPGKRYYFTLSAVNVCAKSHFSQEVSAVPGSGNIVIANKANEASQSSLINKKIQAPFENKRFFGLCAGLVLVLLVAVILIKKTIFSLNEWQEVGY